MRTWIFAAVDMSSLGAEADEVGRGFIDLLHDLRLVDIHLADARTAAVPAGAYVRHAPTEPIDVDLATEFWSFDSPVDVFELKKYVVRP